MMDICTVDRETIASLYQYQYLYRSIEHQLLQPYWVPFYRALYELIFLYRDLLSYGTTMLRIIYLVCLNWSLNI